MADDNDRTTSDQITMLQAWMQDRFDEQSKSMERQDVRLDSIEHRVTASEQAQRETSAAVDLTNAAIAKTVDRVEHMESMFFRLERIANSFEHVFGLIDRGRKGWVAWGTAITAFLVFIQLVSKFIAGLGWPW